MSHSKERKEKICLNCNASLYGRYCHVCGQENIEPKQSTWHLVTHFFYDITHFDGSFFITLKDLIIKPGFLSRQYMEGKRASYLNPVRMYVFTSAFFFIIFFSVFNLKDWKAGNHVKLNTKSMEDARQTALKGAGSKEDSASIEAAFSGIKKIPVVIGKDSSNDTAIHSNISLFQNGTNYKTLEQYDSIQQSLPARVRDGWLTRLFTHKQIDLNNKYRGNKSDFLKEWINVFLHNFPKMLFISLPLFALLLQLLYIRRRRQFYYVDHSIFAIHLYIYSFIALLFIFAINYITNLVKWNWPWFLVAGMALYSLYYFYKAMRNFYRQGGIKTFLKYIILYFLSFIVIIFLFSVFFIFSILEI